MKGLKEMKENNNCNFEKCENTTYHDNNNNCILHMNYKKPPSEVTNIGATSNFKEHLVKFIVDYIFNHNLQKQDIHTTDLATKHYLHEGSISGHLSHILKIPVKFEQLGFPLRYEGEEDDYQYILNRLKTLEFIDCDFDCDSLKNIRVPCSFRGCRFTNNYTIFNHEVLDNKLALYDNCKFLKKVLVKAFVNENYKGTVFDDCEFKYNLKLVDATFVDTIFNASNNIIKIFSLSIKNCIFQNKFVLNNFERLKSKAKRTGVIKISYSIFHSKFELKNNNIGYLTIKDTNFENIVDFFNTTFDEAHFEKCIINDFIGFENCELGNKEGNEKGGKSQFIYTTFKSIPNFRNTKFKSGLNIETSNFKDVPNFLKTEIEPRNTNRETFRIIKNSFDKVGNNIEANKFFALEMSKYKQEIDNTSNKREKIIFWINKNTSDFGQNYWLATELLALSFLYYFWITIGYENNFLYEIYKPLNGIFSFISEILNDFAKSIMPFKKFLKEGIEFISLIFYLIDSILIWQIIVAVKRHTKR